MVPKKLLPDVEIQINRIRKLFRILLLVNLSFIVICMLLFGDRFNFWNDAFSSFGSTVTPTGHSNTASVLIFISGIVISSIICFKISNGFSYLQNVPHARLKNQLFRITGTGYLIMMMPCNIVDVIHSLGAAIVFGTLWFFTALLLIEMKHKLKPFRYYLFQLLLHGTVLPYAYTYFTGSITKQVFQKFAVIGLILTISFTVKYSFLSYHQSDQQEDK